MCNLGQTAIGMHSEAVTSVYEIVYHLTYPLPNHLDIHNAPTAGFQAYGEVLHARWV